MAGALLESHGVTATNAVPGRNGRGGPGVARRPHGAGEGDAGLAGQPQLRRMTSPVGKTSARGAASLPSIRRIRRAAERSAEFPDGWLTVVSAGPTTRPSGYIHLFGL